MLNPDATRLAVWGDPIAHSRSPALHAAAYEVERPWTVAEVAALLAQPGSFLLGESRAALVGRVTLDEAELLTIATRPDARRQGLARALLAAFAAEARVRGATVAFLEVAVERFWIELR